MTSVEEWKSNRVHIGLSNTREVLYLTELEEGDAIFRLVVFVDDKHPFVGCRNWIFRYFSADYLILRG